MLRPRAACGLATVALVGLCASAAAAPVQGTLDAVTPMIIEGESVIGGSHALFLAPALVDDSLFRISASRVNVKHYERSVPMVGGVTVGAGSMETLLRDDTYDAADISISHLQMGAVLTTYREESGNQSESEAWLETSGSVVVHARPPQEVHSRNSYEIKNSHLSMALGGGEVTITGDFNMYAWGVRVTVRENQSTAHVYETGSPPSSSTLPVHQKKERWIVATLTGGNFSLRSEGTANTATLYVNHFTASVDGVVRLEGARGQFEAGGHAYEADDRPASVGGELFLEVAPEPADPTTFHLSGTDAPRLQMSFSGDLQYTSLEGVAVPGFGIIDSPAEKAAFVVSTGTLAGRFLWIFYWRLKPDAVLGNSTRRRLLEIARTRPGLSLRAAARQAGVSKTTAHYHLNVLARFGLLLLAKETPDSRVVRVFASRGDHSLVDTPEARAIMMALSRESCRRLARAFLSQAVSMSRSVSASQEAPPVSLSLAEAARETGLSKPTALRHLRALANVGVLKVDGESPRVRRYSLTPSGLRSLQDVAVLLGRTPHGADHRRVPPPPEETPA